MRIIITLSSPKLVFLCLSPYVSQRDESDSLEWDGLERDNSWKAWKIDIIFNNMI